ncbi:Fe2+-dependent dioxygenase [Ferrovibrio xuzhouensis]|uniref:Fe2+-dependent dioxygenase n=1 Tax=Ferrovibrio xuzhouensis TaxID=1576914 RepID=A0ABV7VDI4_9PROT
MMLKLYEVLTRPEVAAFRAALAAPDAGWIGGAVTAGQQARIVKKNRQLPEQSPLNQRLGQAILQALARHAPFFAAALPLRITPPQFNVYEGGETYGDHIDNALRLTPDGGRLRADLSATLFLSQPGEYEGGELIVQDSYGEYSVKMPAGDMVLYPSASRHRVTPVTGGSRVGCFLWIQSMVRGDADRDMLHGLDLTIQRLTVEHGPGNTEVGRLTGLYHNLVRRFAET